MKQWIQESIGAMVFIGVWIATVALFGHFVGEAETRLRGDMAEMRTEFRDLRKRVDVVISNHGERITRLESGKPVQP